MGSYFARGNSALALTRGVSMLSLFALCSISAQGCAGVYNSARSLKRDIKANSTSSSSPLTTQTTSAARLASVNSVELATPVLSSTGSTGSLSSAEARDMIERAARETMTLKISVKGEKGSPSQSAARQALATDSDAILRTEVLRFEERQGSAIGGEPAVVSFRMSLRDRGGAELWSASYFLKQEALSENLLRINERVGPEGLGAGWRSAHYVFQRGVESALKDLNSKREQQFLAGR